LLKQNQKRSYRKDITNERNNMEKAIKKISRFGYILIRAII